jgi:hexosaminidase
MCLNWIQEIDTPGHTAVISEAHPELVACAQATPWSTYANEPPAGQLRLASPSAVNFTVGMLSSVAGMFPSTLFSTGGDEINAKCYADDAQTQHDLNGRTLEQALGAFTQATHGALKTLGKTPVVWEGATYPVLHFVWGAENVFCLGMIEMVTNYNLTLDNNTIAM